MKLGRRIYYDKIHGTPLVNTGEHEGGITRNTIEQDIKTYYILSERVRDSFDFIDLDFGQFSQDFVECIGYRVNPQTSEIEFSYPNSSETNPSEPVYQKSLSEEVQELKTAQATTDSTLLELMESILLT